MELKGSVFNIQKFSIHDGPGIRTVVFLKGCPLRCGWCSNPESQLTEAQILRDGKKCVHCGRCVSLCETGALSIKGGRVMCEHEKCRGCLKCVSSCPTHALTSEGSVKTVEECMKAVLQDMPFYEESGGGVTISGGEALMQPEFTKALLMACHEKGIHTAIETTSFADTDTYLDVTAEADLLLCDLKHWDSARHEDGTGVRNELILKNIKAAASAGREILIRIPVIPGFNDSQYDAEKLSDCIKSLGLKKVQLLPFHQFGENKYELLGKEYRYRDVPALHPEDIENIKQIMTAAGLDVII